MAGSSFNPRAHVRDDIVQQWSATTTATATGNGTPQSVSHTPSPLANGHRGTCGMEMQTPATPPITAEDEKLWRDQDLNDKIMRQVEENGITRPSGHKVSFHYNSRVEDMHFGKTHPMKPWRLTLTKHLVLGHGLQYAMDTYEAVAAGKDEVCQFHDRDYVDFLSEVNPDSFRALCKISRFYKATPPKHEGMPFNSVVHDLLT